MKQILISALLFCFSSSALAAGAVYRLDLSSRPEDNCGRILSDAEYELIKTPSGRSVLRDLRLEEAHPQGDFLSQAATIDNEQIELKRVEADYSYSLHAIRPPKIEIFPGWTIFKKFANRSWLPEQSRYASHAYFDAYGALEGLGFKSVYELLRFTKNGGPDLYRRLNLSRLELHIHDERFNESEFIRAVSEFKDVTHLAISLFPRLSAEQTNASLVYRMLSTGFKLESLDLSGTSLQNDEAMLAPILKLNPKLKSLSLFQCHITDLTAAILSSLQLPLMELNVGNNSQISDRFFQLLVPTYSRLQVIRADSTSLGDLSAQIIANHMHKLRWLDFSITDISEEGVEALAFMKAPLEILTLRQYRGQNGRYTFAVDRRTLQQLKMRGLRVGDF